MAHRVLVLGAGFAGLELTTRLRELLGDEVSVTLIDKGEAFVFGFSKLDLMLGRKATNEVRLPYRDLQSAGIDFRQDAVLEIDPGNRRVVTDGGTHEADVLAIALGARYDFDATPGFAEHGHEFYSVKGAARLPEVIESFDSGKVLIGILGHPFKCPPAPFEGALLLHDHFSNRGVRDRVQITVAGPQSAPVPIAKQVSEGISKALAEREIEYLAQQVVGEVEPGIARVNDGPDLEFDLFIGVPVHRVPGVVAESGLAPEGWVTVDPRNLRTSADGVYALGDVAGTPVPKAGVFAEGAARIVAADISAQIRNEEFTGRWTGEGECYLEFGGGSVGKVQANFLGGEKPTGELIGPSPELAAEKKQFAADRKARWFGA